MKRLITAMMAVLFLGGTLLPGTAHADTLTFKVRSFSKYAVNIAFFSKNRKHAWPSTTTVYTIKDYKVADFALSCIQGESIGYGAAVKGNPKVYWGRSTDGKQACQNCCYTCNGKTVTPIVNLNE